MKLMFEQTNNSSMPRSANTIRDIMHQIYVEKKEALIEKIKHLQENGVNFRLSLDGWTSAGNLIDVLSKQNGSGLHSYGTDEEIFPDVEYDADEQDPDDLIEYAEVEMDEDYFEKENEECHRTGE
ncbi:unnamed protein product [Orchesella dallaii]|uniref:Uncharacterized protein n=1 Tax=Orchesella dallaii TaxID=48710 RepID=A0ABP1PZI0_9HEXA